MRPDDRAKDIDPSKKPLPEVGDWWLFDNKEKGRVRRILPGGSRNLGIVEFDGLVPAAHVDTMLRYRAWQPCDPPVGLEPPCTCVTLEGGVVLSDGCAKHNAADAKLSPSDVTKAIGYSIADGMNQSRNRP